MPTKYTVMEDRCRHLAFQAHANSKLYGAYPYFTHVEAVAKLAKRLGCPETIVSACFLHDVLEDTDFALKVALVDQFGYDEVYRLVEAVTDEPGANRKEKKAKTYIKTFKAGQAAIIVKLCDRLINTMFCHVVNPKLLKMYKEEYWELRKALKPEPLDTSELLGYIEFKLWMMVEAISV